MIEITHIAGTPFHLRWNYGSDLSDVAITATISSAAGDLSKLKVLPVSLERGEIDLIATATTTGAWPRGRLAIDVRLLRGDVDGRLDTVFFTLK